MPNVVVFSEELKPGEFVTVLDGPLCPKPVKIEIVSVDWMPPPRDGDTLEGEAFEIEGRMTGPYEFSKRWAFRSYKSKLQSCAFREEMTRDIKQQIHVSFRCHIRGLLEKAYGKP